MNRRALLTGLASALAAPVIVRSSSLMQIRGVVMPPAEPVYFIGEQGLYVFYPTQVHCIINSHIRCSDYSDAVAFMAGSGGPRTFEPPWRDVD